MILNNSRGTTSRGCIAILGCMLPALGVLLFAWQVTQPAEGANQPGEGVTESPSDRPPALETPARPGAEEPAVRAARRPPKPRCKTCRPAHRKPRAGTQCSTRLRSIRCRRRVCPAVAKKPNLYAWKNLFDGKTLKGWKVPEFGGEGEVYVKDGMIVMEMGSSMTGITWTGDLPRNDYELTLEGMRIDGCDFFCTTTFPVGKDQCSLVTGGWGGMVVGLSNVDYYDASDNMTTTFYDFKPKTWYPVRIRVTAAKIEAWIGDEQVVDQPRKGHKFGIRAECDLCQPLGISTWCTTGAVRNIRIRRLTSD